jgi:predicted O-methyltransferase YrrM
MNNFTGKMWTCGGPEIISTYDALRWLAAEVKPASYLEIGVSGGRSMQTIFEIHRPDRMVLCDLWDPNQTWGGSGNTNHRHISDWLYARGYPDSSVRFLDGDSKVLIPTLKEQFELILVDGNHSAEGALQDLINCWPLLSPNGIMILDDVAHPSYPGVALAFTQFISCTPDVDFVMESRRVWWHRVALMCKRTGL